MTTTSAYTTARENYDAAVQSCASSDYTPSDLMKLGMSQHAAAKLRNDTPYSAHLIETGTGVPFTQNPNDVIAIVASNETARASIQTDGWYARACSLTLPVPQCATAIAINENKAIERVYPIRARWFVPAPTATIGPGQGAPPTSLTNLITSLKYATTWLAETSVFLLDEPVALPTPVPLGYDAVPGTRCYTWNTLTTATVLKGAPTCRS